MCFRRFFGNPGEVDFSGIRDMSPPPFPEKREKNAVFREIVLIRDHFCRLDPKNKYKWPFFLSIFKNWFFVYREIVLTRDGLRWRFYKVEQKSRYFFFLIGRALGHLFFTFLHLSIKCQVFIFSILNK